MVFFRELIYNYNPVNIVNPNWKISKSKIDKYTYFYYLNTQGGSLEAENKLSLPMSNFFVASEYSGTSTSIAFHLGNLVDGREELNRTIRVEDSPSENVVGSSIPLDASWVSDNTVLNDGSTSDSLTFSLSYPSSRVHTIINQNSNDPSSLKLSDKSRFILAFDYGDDKYGLTTEGILNKFGVSVSDTTNWQVEPLPNSYNPTYWSIKPKSEGLEFHAATGFEITVSSIVTEYTRGYTNLYLYYQNIPGYEDGEFILPINKTSVCVTEHGKVGIGTRNPQIDLAIGNGVTGLDYNQNQVLSVIAPNGLDIRGGKIAIWQNWMLGNENHNFYISANNQKSLLINNNGNVGIGTRLLILCFFQAQKFMRFSCRHNYR